LLRVVPCIAIFFILMTGWTTNIKCTNEIPKKKLNKDCAFRLQGQ
jgi:hypothetical protein